MTTTDNSGNVKYKSLVSRRWDLELCGYVVHEDQSVPHRTAPTTIATTIVLAIAENEKNVHKTRKITETLTPVDVIDKHEGCNWQVLQEFADEWTETKFVNNSSTPSQMATSSAGYLLGFSETKEINPSNWKHDDIRVLAWGTRTRDYWDEELGILINETRSVVAHGTSLPTPTTISWPAQVQADEARDIRTVLVPIAGAYTRTWVSTIQYSFPTLLAYWNGSEADAPVPANGLIFTSAFEEDNARSVFKIIVQLRESFTQDVYATFTEDMLTSADAALLTAAAENTTAFGSGGDLGSSTPGAPTKARIFNPRPRDISYDGLMFTLRVPNVLCDSYLGAAKIVATANSEDEYYGPSKSEEFEFPPSNITATAYVALIDSYVCIKDEVTLWKFGMYKRLRVKIKIK